MRAVERLWRGEGYETERYPSNHAIDLGAVGHNDRLIGETIGRYRILDQVGEGGFSTVYLERDPQTNRIVAVKVLREDSAIPDIAMRAGMK